MKAFFKIMAILLALAMLAGVMGYLAGFFETKIPAHVRGVVPAADAGPVLTVEALTEPVIEQAAGTIRAKIETVISPLITATISSFAVRAGDEVAAGDVLVELDSRELDARVDQVHQGVVAAEARLAQTEKDFQRVQRIFRADSGAISKAELERAQAAVRTARAEVLRARRREDEGLTALSYGTLTAPIAGRIVERYADPGDTARPGEPLLRMYDPMTLRLEANVRESVASKLVKGQSLTVKVDALDRRFAAVVDEIVPSADPGSRSFLVKVSLTADSGLYPGMFGRLLIPLGQTRKIYIPLKAVTHVGQLDFVLVRTPQGPARRYVRLGTRGREDQVEVISGLAAGEEILISQR
ncbi:MAG: efflux RND transporter periplasmic adaptor subunit [Desulfobacterales bacterium]|nr:MAG: efflux RND transporter periplasmic adaptor subunit [Desulfobacterales bacterium]